VTCRPYRGSQWGVAPMAINMPSLTGFFRRPPRAYLRILYSTPTLEGSLLCESGRSLYDNDGSSAYRSGGKENAKIL